MRSREATSTECIEQWQGAFLSCVTRPFSTTSKLVHESQWRAVRVLHVERLMQPKTQHALQTVATECRRDRKADLFLIQRPVRSKQNIRKCRPLIKQPSLLVLRIDSSLQNGMSISALLAVILTCHTDRSCCSVSVISMFFGQLQLALQKCLLSVLRFLSVSVTLHGILGPRDGKVLTI